MARRYGLVVFLFALGFVVVFSQNGVLEYVKLRKQIDIVDRSAGKLEAENAVLKGQIERLQNDDQYLEDVAREKYGFIREGEKVYRVEK
ncbi:MAG TPA: septum formation initiator family protein [Syntrophorhabdales bacterium]|nr:septum formation initiator family protein [Syntrophorhabdales bacterium]